MLVALLAAALVLVIVAAALLLRSAKAREAVLERERARLEAEGEDLRARLAERVQQVDTLAPYRPLAEAAEDWVWASDDEGTLTYSNAAGAKLLGIEDLIGRSLTELTHAEDKPVGWNGVVRRIHADGSLRMVDSRSVQTDGGWQGIDRDLSAPSPEPIPQGVAVVRWPVVDGRREVVAYELVGDGDVIDGFPPAELLELGGGRPVWVTLHGDEMPELDAMRTVLQIAAETEPERAAALAAAGFVLALEGFAGASPLLEHCGIVKVAVGERDDEALTELIHGPAERGLELVATGVATADEFTRCRVLGFSHFQGEFFARPSGEGGGGAVGSLQALSELAGSDASFEELERIIGADVGLSLALLRHVNSAFFALPRKIDTTRRGADAARHPRGPALGDRGRSVLDARGAGPARRARAAARAHVRAAGAQLERGRARAAVHRRAVLGRRRAAGHPDGEGARDAAVLGGDRRRAAALRGPARARPGDASCATSRATSRPRAIRRSSRTPTSPRSSGPTGRVAGSPDEPGAAAVQAHAGVHRGDGGAARVRRDRLEPARRLEPRQRRSTTGSRRARAMPPRSCAPARASSRARARRSRRC